MKLFFGLKSQDIRQVNEHLFVIYQKRGLGHQLTYFLRGAYGNFWVGVPQFNEALAQFVKDQGGVFRIFPFNSPFGAAEQQWFNRFGCALVVTDAQSANPHNVPVLASGASPVVGVEVMAFEHEGSRYHWAFKWRQRTFCSARTQAVRGSLLPDQLNGDLDSLCQRLAAVDTLGPSAMSASELLARFAVIQPQTLMWPIDELGVLAVFDDTRFEVQDCEFLRPQQRQDIANLMAQLAFRRENGNVYRGPGDVAIRLAKPIRSLSADPLSSVELEPGDLGIVTPTQAALLILRHKAQGLAWQQACLLQLVARLPVNLDKLRGPIAALFSPEAAAALNQELKACQQSTVAHYKNARPKGLTGRLPRLESADGNASPNDAHDL